MVPEKDELDSMIGKRVGVYELRRELGRGGMGAVYLAERVDGEFRQRVAVKLIKRGMDTDAILKRFRRERQIIATLDHPNITFFLSGGSTGDGLPFFVMEYIEGLPLYQFCDDHRLSIEERLRLFQKICSAVEAAHRINVIHRDLKPSNILVKADGTPKLLDFGIAKVLNPELVATEIEPTATEMLVMTPDYASPEQITGDQVTPASDIYSLGLMLYELLTGQRPYALKRRVPHEVARVVCEQNPQPPSRVTTDSDLRLDDLSYISENASFQSSSEFSQSNLQSDDLDKIVMKTLRKNPLERYQTAAALAEDISNFLAQRPVKAESFETAETPPREKFSVAVLPLKLLSAKTQTDTGDEFLSFGLADALVSRLSTVRRLIVRPTSSILRYSQMNVDSFTAGQELGVEYVVDGTIRRIGERIRVTIQLLSVGEHATHWAQSFDEKFTDVLEMEDLISERIVKTLIPQLTGEEKNQLARRGTNSVKAYEAYLRGRFYWNLFTGDALIKALEFFNQAIALDPNYALPHVGLADYYAWLSIFGLMPSNEGFLKSKESARRALEIDDQSGEAYAVLGFVTLCYDWNWADAERLLKRALELAPNYSLAHEFYSNVLVSSGRFEEGAREINRAEELAPLSPRALLMSAWTFYQTRAFDESVRRARSGNEMQKDFPQGLLHLGNALTEIGKTAEAVEKLRRSSELWKESGMAHYMLCFALAAEGEISEAQDMLEELKRSAEQGYVKPYFVAMGYIALGDHDAAFEWFEKAFAERNEWFIWFGTEPKLDPVRDDARYLDLLKRTTNPIRRNQADPATTAEREKSIAVLPFKVISAAKTGDTEEEYLGIGLADALISRLSNVRLFIVRPTSSVLHYDDQTNPFEAGRELNVEYILDGTIRRVGERIRAGVQLLDVKNNATRRAENFDEKFTDILELEDLISERVVQSLVPHLTGEEQKNLSRRATNKAEAYKAFMRGRYFWNQFTAESLPKAIIGFQQAVVLDPDYAPAYVGIADFYNWACIYGIFPPAESNLKAEEAVRRALEINPDLGEAYATLGLNYLNYKNWEGAEKSFRRAIELAPYYPHAHEWYSALLIGAGNFEQGVKEIYRAEELNPLDIRQMTLTTWTIYMTRRFDEALEKSREIIALDAKHPQGYMQMCNILCELGRGDEAVDAGRQALELMPGSFLPVYNYCFALAAAGRLDEARKVAADLQKSADQNYVKPYFLAMSCFAIDEDEQGFKYLRQSFDEKDPWLVWIKNDPKFDRLHQDPRYLELIEKSNFPEVDEPA